MKPTFLFIGPDKSGSTWLYEILRQHPRCFVPALKDIYFFDRHYDRGLDWYLSHFDGATTSARAVGELSHDYLFSARAADRIRKDLPDVMLLACLREPVERTFSHYLYMIRSGRTTMPFDAALEAFPELINNSRYATHLRTYLDRFPKEQVGVLWFDDLEFDPRLFAAQCFAMLGVEFVEGLPYGEKVLAASKPRVRALAWSARQGANLARAVGLSTLVGVVKRSFVKALLYKPYAQANKPTMDAASRAHLRTLFEPELVELERMLGVDLAHWRTGERRDALLGEKPAPVQAPPGARVA